MNDAQRLDDDLRGWGYGLAAWILAAYSEPGDTILDVDNDPSVRMSALTSSRRLTAAPLSFVGRAAAPPTVSTTPGTGPMDDELMTPDEVCTYLKVNKDWLYDQVQARRTPHLRLGRQLRFRRSDLLDSLGSRSVAVEPPTAR